MNQVSDAPAPRSWRWAAGAAAGTVLFGLWLASSMWITSGGGTGAAAEGPAFGSLALLFVALAAMIALLALLLGHALARARYGALLVRARAESRALTRLLDTWRWQSDSALRMTRLAAPVDAADGAAAHVGQPVWERWRSEDGSGLRERLEAHAPLRDVAVVQHDDATRWLLRAEPLADAEGSFAGYLGSARALDAPARAAAASTATEPEGGFSDQEAFSYTVSHDLRAPIRVVEGFTRIVKEDYARALDRIGLDHLDRVLGAAARMNNMIDALLNLSRLSTQPLARQPVNLSQLAGFVVDDLRRTAPERNVQVHVQPDLIAQGDPTLLRVVLENLLGNAWKYSARNETAQIRFECGGSAAVPAFTVRDNGAGFDMRYADRLFGVFQRLHSSSEFQGTGVGLASVRRIIRRHGGEIWADAEVGRGAAFHFTLRC